MRTVDMHEARAHLSRLVREEFIITEGGRPVARVIPAVEAPAVPRIGFLPHDVARAMVVPDDFDEMRGEETADLFETDR